MPAANPFKRYRRIKATRDGPILTLTLDNGPVNAVDGVMHHELSRIFHDAQDDPESDLVILTGANKAYCAGGDMDWFDRLIEEPRNFRVIDELQMVFFSHVASPSIPWTTPVRWQISRKGSILRSGGGQEARSS